MKIKLMIICLVTCVNVHGMEIVQYNSDKTAERHIAIKTSLEQLRQLRQSNNTMPALIINHFSDASTTWIKNQVRNLGHDKTTESFGEFKSTLRKLVDDDAKKVEELFCKEGYAITFKALMAMQTYLRSANAADDNSRYYVISFCEGIPYGEKAFNVYLNDIKKWNGQGKSVVASLYGDVLIKERLEKYAQEVEVQDYTTVSELDLKNQIVVSAPATPHSAQHISRLGMILFITFLCFNGVR